MEWINDQFFKAIAMGDTNEIKSFLESGANVNATNTIGQTPLIVAASDVYCLELSLNNGAGVDTIDNNGYTALMEASQMGNVDTVALLVSRGANVAAVSHGDLQTAFHIAAKSGQSECIELLLKYGSKVDASGRTALMDTAAKGDGACLGQLLKHGARINFEEALKLAVDGGHAECEVALRSHLKGKMMAIKGKKNKALFKKVSLVVLCTALTFAGVKRLNKKKKFDFFLFKFNFKNIRMNFKAIY